MRDVHGTRNASVGGLSERGSWESRTNSFRMAVTKRKWKYNIYIQGLRLSNKNCPQMDKNVQKETSLVRHKCPKGNVPNFPQFSPIKHYFFLRPNINPIATKISICNAAIIMALSLLSKPVATVISISDLLVSSWLLLSSYPAGFDVLLNITVFCFSPRLVSPPFHLNTMSISLLSPGFMTVSFNVSVVSFPSVSFLVFCLSSCC